MHISPLSHTHTQLISYLLAPIVHYLTCKVSFSHSMINYKILHTIFHLITSKNPTRGKSACLPASTMSAGGNSGAARRCTTILGSAHIFLAPVRIPRTPNYRFRQAIYHIFRVL